MAANTAPIFSRTPDIQWITGMTAANNTIDITSGTSYLAFTADATEGGFVRTAILKPSPSQNTAATVWRIWINNGSATGTKANSALIKEVSIPATTTSASAAQPEFTARLDIALPPGYKIYFTLGTAPGGTGEFTGTVIGGKY